MNKKPLIVVLAVLLMMLMTSATASAGRSAGRDDRDDPEDQLDAVRDATAAFRNIDAAVAAGYGLLRDAKGIACIDNPKGGMGIHYVNGALIGAGAVNATTPQALVYEPRKNGKLRLVAVEYVVFQAAWDAAHSSPPSLFGRQFELLASPNRYGLPAFYELHAWIWKHNPSGMFADWNPRVSCRYA